LAALDTEYTAASAAAPGASPDTYQLERNYHVARLREVFGPEFRVLPRFSAFEADTLGRSFAASTSLQGNDSLASVTWLQRAARVRAGAARLDAILMYGEAVGGSTAALKVGQLPFNGTADRWVGLTAPASEMPGGRVSIVAHAPTAIDTARPLA